MEFVNLIRPKHDRTSCSDSKTVNGFFSRNGQSWHGRCTRCMYLELVRDQFAPEGFDPDEC
jgi:hypothetical protein